MSLILHADAQGTVELRDYVAALDAFGDELDDDALLSTLPDFRRLLNNRSMLTDHLAAELASQDGFQVRNPWVGPSFVLHRTPAYTIRVNLWVPPASRESVKEWENNLYASHLPHDHNFSFLTGGYLGSGYRTERYEYDPEETASLAVGDKVRTLTDLGTAQLDLYSCMFYRASRDVHVQHYPDELSVSVNVLLRPRGSRPQILFEPGLERVTRLVSQPATMRTTLERIAAYSNDAVLLERLARTRGSANEAARA
jgi:hypothetical protein